MAKIRWTKTLKGLRKGDVATFPLSAYSVVSSTINRLKTDMSETNANWEVYGRDWEEKTFKVRRIA